MSPYNDQYMSNLTLMFNSTGAGVQVSCHLGLLHVKFSAPPVMFVRKRFYLNKTRKHLVINAI